MFQREFDSNRPAPSSSMVIRLIKKFEETGCLDQSHHKQQRPTRALSENVKDNIKNCVRNNPCQSLSDISREIGISVSSVHKTLKAEKFRAYKVFHCQELKEADYEKRHNFCKIMLDKVDSDANFVKNILFSDESTFVLVHAPNKQNTRYQKKLNVWLGILGENIIGPIFIEGNLNADKYLQLIRDEVDGRVRSVTANTEIITFQQDGAPPHTARMVTHYLHQKYPGRWIGKNGPIEWPPQSPDLAPLDFGIWGMVKNRMYDLEIETLQQLKDCIIEECESITPLQLQNVLQCFVKRLETCSAVAGGLFEHYL
ncbi:uncharacterized protein [Prorops nasuta]|uniref:uncharacterized protein n=1 Tax=Prorops nasuta TaxID=863751 RepID=UPI0034CE2D23